ncbi:MAG: hypothetical protein JXA49_10380 [Actinobacteria bacterium]|nr:hypothetical protein [Actinomycetota bacterium]
MEYEPRFAVIEIGSMPHEDPIIASDLMIGAAPEFPAWPQLSNRSFLENMYVQYAEGLPGIHIDEPDRRIWFQVDDETVDGLEPFYEAVIEEDLDRFAISGDFAKGLELFLRGQYKNELSRSEFIKGHTTGPVSFGLTLTDQNKKAALYNETIEEVIVKGLTLKARWQCRELAKAAPGSKVVMFFDEPYLVSVGSALISVSREQVVSDMKQCIEGCGADITGMHCCGNTDWSIVFDTGVDIVHFDAFEFMEGFIAYSEEIKNHLAGGKMIAWGLVPNREAIFDITVDDLCDSLEDALLSLELKGVNREMLAARSFVSHSCGLGPTTVEVAERALDVVMEVSERMRTRYFKDA